MLFARHVSRENRDGNETRQRSPHTKIDIKAFALTWAVLWGLGLPLVTWWGMAFDGPSSDPTWLGHICRGYNLTLAGSLIGGVWAFFDALIGGAVFAWLYNYLGERVTIRHRIAA